jgi:hypothetical protein
VTVRTQREKAAEPEAPEPRRFTTQEALEEAGRRRDERMGRPAKETKAGAADRAAAVAGELDQDEPDDAYKGMEFAELQRTAKERELSAGGSADQIKARLREADAAPVAPAAGDQQS